ncbi:MAG: nuclear transport factor 2 family protein [Pseudomonadota bacterium]
MPTLNREFAERFAKPWIAAFNAHELEAILSHDSDDFKMSSPVLAETGIEASGTLIAKAAVGAYWQRAPGPHPDLKFGLQRAAVGVGSVAIIDQGVRGFSCEAFFFADDARVSHALAHYA